MEVGSNRSIKKAEVYHQKSTKSWAPATQPKEHASIKWILWRAWINQLKRQILNSCWQPENAWWAAQWWKTSHWTLDCGNKLTTYHFW